MSLVSRINEDRMNISNLLLYIWISGSGCEDTIVCIFRIYLLFVRVQIILIIFFLLVFTQILSQILVVFAFIQSKVLFTWSSDCIKAIYLCTHLKADIFVFGTNQQPFFDQHKGPEFAFVITNGKLFLLR